MSDNSRKKRIYRNHETGAEFVTNGCILSASSNPIKEDADNLIFGASGYGQGLASEVDLRPFMSPIEQQSQTSSW